MNVGVVINYSSLDEDFLIHTEDELYSNDFTEIEMVCWSHLFNGERDEALQAFDLAWYAGESTRFYHNYARFHGFMKIHDKVDHIIFLDGDEVPDGRKLRKWVDNDYLGMPTKISNYWYFKAPTLRAKEIEDSAVIVPKEALQFHNFFHESERHGLVDKWIRYGSYKNKPIIHHYSWAKSREVLEKKIETWGHKNDAIDWSGMIDYMFSEEFDKKLVVPFNNYKLKKVKSFI